MFQKISTHAKNANKFQQQENYKQQIIFCTRTHSQMSQIVGELKKCSAYNQRVKIVTLTSRKGLCVHERIKTFEIGALNEKCEDLQDTVKCPYRDGQLTQILTENILVSPLDIEELGQLATKMQICGYYGAREAANEADIIVTPYQSILSQTARAALGISLFNKILVFDEAHNIMETISNLNTVKVSYSNLYQGHSQTQAYLRKYEARMSQKNAKFLRDLSQLCCDFSKYLKKVWTETIKENCVQKEVALDVMVMLTDLDLYRIDFSQLNAFFQKADLARKISGFIQQNSPQNEGQRVWHTLQSLIEALSLSPLDGKLVIQTSSKIQECSIEYICLNPSVFLNRIIEESNKVILSSGTLEPAGDFNMIKTNKHRFSCGHIVGPSQFKAICVDAGFNFQFNQRDQMLQKMVELTQWVYKEQSSRIGGGVIVFVQSYATQQKFKVAFGEHEGVLWESQGKDEAFLAHQKSIKEGKSSVLICVIGGKLSEGINFSDDLARTVIVFGLPYPNNQAAAIKEKMRFYDEFGPEDFKGKQFYENMCMRTVNQAIGRALRHAGDYACIIIVDQRLISKADTRAKFPKWIQQRLVLAQTLTNCQTEVIEFYKQKQQMI